VGNTEEEKLGFLSLTLGAPTQWKKTPHQS